MNILIYRSNQIPPSLDTGILRYDEVYAECPLESSVDEDDENLYGTYIFKEVKSDVYTVYKIYHCINGLNGLVWMRLPSIRLLCNEIMTDKYTIDAITSLFSMPDIDREDTIPEELLLLSDVLNSYKNG